MMTVFETFVLLGLWTYYQHFKCKEMRMFDLNGFSGTHRRFLL